MHEKLSRRSVVIVDNQEPFCTTLGRAFKKLGLSPWLSSDITQARAICHSSTPGLIVTELRVSGEWAFDFIQELRGELQCPAVIVTAYPSVATAVRAVQTGFQGYFAKPCTAQTILDVFETPEKAELADEVAWPSLDRTIWEYINHVYVSAGTMSEAARRLRIDRRSLRRMLAKNPPP